MLWPFPGNTKITTPWNDPRPISNPGEHPHGAIDIGTQTGSKIVAPEPGGLYLYFAVRPNFVVHWPGKEMESFPYRNYFYDMFGGIAVLRGESGLTHVFAHLYMNTMHNKQRHDWAFQEQREDSRFPVFSFMAGEIKVREGDFIGETGNSGYSSGPHCHYEIHNGFIWQNWKDRPDPEKIEWENFR